MKRDSNMQNIMERINKDIDEIKIYKSDRTDNNIIDDEINFNSREKNLSFLSLNSDLNSRKSNISESQLTYVSEPFNEEKDLDLPYFSPTKYNSLCWRFTHSSTYLLYNIFLFASSIILFIQKNEFLYIIFLLIAHVFYLISASQQWFYYKRGCFTYANYNSKVKANIDKSFKAKVLRAEEGFKYFFSLFASCILIYGNIYYFTLGKQKLEPEFWNINLVGTMIICLSQILKLEKILTDSKQFSILKNLSLALIEIFMFFGSLCFGSLYLIQMLYYNMDTYKEVFNILFPTLYFTGSVSILLSGVCLLNRYFCSGYEDLNASDLSNVSI